ncbi:hypothetical protein GIB67_041096, partial [Kingdonia uniflora]
GYWDSDEHFDIAEVVVTDSAFREGCLSYALDEDWYLDEKFSIRVGMCGFLRVFDGPDDGVSGLVHLLTTKMLMVRPVDEVRGLKDVGILRVRVEILRSAFDECESLWETTKQPWKKSMMCVMAWLRPEVTTQETRYGFNNSDCMEIDANMQTDSCSSVLKRRNRFDPTGFYEAIKPSKGQPVLEDEFPDLLPELRPYQRRAAYWMVQREKGSSESLGERDHTHFVSPLCAPMDFLHTCSKMYYNPFSGNISLHSESSSSYVCGGILADEMGLGKTVELLACIFAHSKPKPEGSLTFDKKAQVTGVQRNSMKRLKLERVECVCGAVTESVKYKGLWVQCDSCDAWQHADCVGYSPKRKSSGSRAALKAGFRKKGPSIKSRKHVKEKNVKEKSASNTSEMDGSHICQLCLELIEAAQSPVETGATLIVCPSPILHQWHSEISRHTRPGSLRTCVYGGVRNASFSDESTMDISDLVSADIVLTTYDVLKEDLSHDSDRHEGDRRLMRFKKRYPVLPTLLTRIFWWRVCLDEAQMVENNVSAATEMALRLHAKYRWCVTGTPIQRGLDDLYGLLRFLNARPFEVYKWWLEVIKDPYERKEAGAMQFAHRFFKQIMWRSSKVHVADELQLPIQEEYVTWLVLSPVETHFYQRQHETCLNYAREVIESYKDDILKKKVQGSESCDVSSDVILTHIEAAKLLHSLLKLRQACCHPQVGSSGLRSMQHSPMTMEEILGVLVGKTKTEGEEALRKLVVALNGLAGLAYIERDLSRALSIYKEALTISKEHFDDFRLDPLLYLHIYHNMVDILPLVENPKRDGEFDQCSAKRQRMSYESNTDSTFKNSHLEHREKVHDFTALDLSDVSIDAIRETADDAYPQILSRSFSVGCLRKKFEDTKQNFSSVFLSRLSLAQLEFKNSYMQVSNASGDQKKQHFSWWLEAFHDIENTKNSSNEFIKKVSEAISETSNNKKSRIASRFRSISGLKYLIQTGLDSLETSRHALLERLLDIDKTMEEPRDEDILRLRYCPIHGNGEGCMCAHCELEELFQVYEARLFFHKKGGDGEIITSPEEFVNLQKKSSALNNFFMDIGNPSKGLSSSLSSEESKKMRHANSKETIVKSKSPSELEIVLRILKTYAKPWLGIEGKAAAAKQLRLLEESHIRLIFIKTMRKEFTYATSLANAQAKVMAIYDEIKVATSRLNGLSSEEVIVQSAQYTSEKFMSLSLLSRTKGQLRYLQGLVFSKQKTESDPTISSVDVETMDSSVPIHIRDQGECEACPVCHENLTKQKMVFQCGHVICCKCLLVMTEHRLFPLGKSCDKWVMCPTCRQHTDLINIAYADDRLVETSNSTIPSSFSGYDKPEASIHVVGSYGTKIEAVTKRILWIKCMDPNAKILLFSSWNDVLDVLEHALFANNITSIRMKGGRKSHVAIAQFKEENNVARGTRKMHGKQPEIKTFQVLLLLFQHGANGLNLLEAQHVILIEPLLNPATEAQAINRVHRIGQDKTTVVHRFIVKDTVEESIYKLNRSRVVDSVINVNTKNQDQSVLTLKDVESLFAAVAPSMPDEEDNIPVDSLRHMPPAVAASIAAERRRNESLI